MNPGLFGPALTEVRKCGRASHRSLNIASVHASDHGYATVLRPLRYSLADCDTQDSPNGSQSHGSSPMKELAVPDSNAVASVKGRHSRELTLHTHGLNFGSAAAGRTSVRVDCQAWVSRTTRVPCTTHVPTVTVPKMHSCALNCPDAHAAMQHVLTMRGCAMDGRWHVDTFPHVDSTSRHCVKRLA